MKEERPHCGKCGKEMTPQNSMISPELFLCDGCTQQPVPEVLYFGRRFNSSGHSLYSQRRIGVLLDEQPWFLRDFHIDTGLLKMFGVKDDPKAGIAVVVQTDIMKLTHPPIRVPWTAISFWDRSGDSRPGSNSAFIVQAEMLPRELLSLARLQWPEIFERPNFPVLKKLRMEVDL